MNFCLLEIFFANIFLLCKYNIFTSKKAPTGGDLSKKVLLKVLQKPATLLKTRL